MTATADATDSSTVEQLITAVDKLTSTIEQQANRIDELEQELADYKDHTGREHADIRHRITQTEETVESLENRTTEGDSVGTTPRDETDETGSRTPLDRITALPEHIAERELTANQERARFIARDVHDYAEKAPAGLVVDSRTIKKVIAAAEGKRPHTQTVARIMDFLADLGQDGVELIKRRGQKLIVMDPKVADRLTDHERCDRENDPTTTKTVIAGL